MRVQAVAHGETRPFLGHGVETQSDANGRFVVSLPSGAWHTLSARAPIGPGSAPMVTIAGEIELAAEPGDVVIVLRRQ